VSFAWYPHPGPQTTFCKSWQDEVLFGGAAGPGKTDCLIMEAARFVDRPQYHGLIARRTFPQLQEIIDRCHKYYPLIGGEWRAGEHRWYFPKGGKVSLGHCQNENDHYNYQGKEYQFIGLDEAGQFLPKQILYLFSRIRAGGENLPKRMRYASNPGGPGHQFLKDRFRIGEYPEGHVTQWEDVKVEIAPNVIIEERISRVFIPGRLSDNPSLLVNDPGYVARLMQLPEIERMRLLKGIWDAFEGQAFIELNYETHGADEFDIPPEWPRYRSFDWGYSAPFSVGWWAVDYDNKLYRYREWYGGKKDEGRQKYVGLRMSATEIARGIIEREAEERQHGIRVNPGPADPSIWNQRRDPRTGVIGPSVADEMLHEGITWLRGDNDRVLGRQQLHSRLQPDNDGAPRMFIFKTCKDWWRTIPLLRESQRNPEDIEQGGDIEDHQYDETRYFLRFRPISAMRKQQTDAGSFTAERRRFLKAKKYAVSHGVSIDQAYGMVR